MSIICNVSCLELSNIVKCRYHASLLWQRHLYISLILVYIFAFLSHVGFLAMVLFREFVEIADKCQCVDGWSKSSYFWPPLLLYPHLSLPCLNKKGPKVCRETSHFFQPCWNCGKITTVISFKALTTSYYLTWKTLSNRNRSLFEDALLIFCWAIIGVKFLTWFTTLIVTICYYYYK